MKKLLGLFLALLMLMSVPAFAAPDYVNLDSTLPFVKEGEEVTLSALVVYDTSITDDPLDRWYYDFLEEFCNVKLEVEAISQEAFNERKSLLFASGDLPDLLYIDLTNAEIVRYGVAEGLLMSYNDYRDIMPNFNAALEKYDGLERFLTTPDGEIYMQGNIASMPEVSAMPRLFTNMAWAKELGIELPETLDEFVDMLYAFKENAETLGVEDMVPLAGGYNFNNPLGIILQAMGYNGDAVNGNNANGFLISVKDGEYCFPVMGEEFGEYLKLANQLYKDGILCSDFFTIDQTTYSAELSAGNYGYVAGPVHAYTSELDVIFGFEAQKPMTSQWNDTPRASYKGYFSRGQFYISANTKYPEVCARLVDAHWDYELSSILWPGPIHGSEYAMDYNGIYFSDEDGDKIWTKSFPGQPEGTSEWNVAIGNWHNHILALGVYNTNESKAYQLKACGAEEGDYVLYTPYDAEFWDTTQGGNHLNWTVMQNIEPYAEYIYPNVWMSDEESVWVSDLETVLKPYIDEQVARFIAGERSIDEVEQFQKELEGMGIRELETFYAEKYAG